MSIELCMSTTFKFFPFMSITTTNNNNNNFPTTNDKQFTNIIKYFS